MIQQFRERPFTVVNIILACYWAPAYPLKHQTVTDHVVCWSSISNVRHHYHSITRHRALVNLVSVLPAHTCWGAKCVPNSICSLSSCLRLGTSVCSNGRTKGNKWAHRLVPLPALVPWTLGNLPETKSWFKPATSSSPERVHVDIYSIYDFSRSWWG